MSNAGNYAFPRNVVSLVARAEKLFQTLTQRPEVRLRLEAAGRARVPMPRRRMRVAPTASAARCWAFRTA